MSTNSTPNNVAAVTAGVVAMFIATAACVAVVSIGLPESQNPAAVGGLFFGGLAATIAALAALVTALSVRKDVKETRSDVAEIKNGTMEAKIRAALADVLSPELVRDDAKDQLVTDRLRAGTSRTQEPTP